MRVLFAFAVHSLLSCAVAVRILRKEQKAKGSNHAIVSLLYGSSPPALLNLRTMMNSARRHGSGADRLVMIPQGDEALGFRSLFESDGVQIVEVPGLEVPAGMRGGGNLDQKQHFSKVMTKFQAFNLTAYDKVLLIDGDAYFSGRGSPDKIFEDCGSHDLCITEDGQPWLFIDDCPENPDLCRMFNTGVMVFTPSAARLQDILEEAEKDHHAYHYPDQQFFSRYIRVKNESLSWKLLDPHWNCCGQTRPLPADPLSRPWVGHLCGLAASHKTKFCTDKPMCPPKYRAWQYEALAMDPCLGKKTQDACGARKGCGWRGTYCMDERIEKTDITFDIEQTSD